MPKLKDLLQGLEGLKTADFDGEREITGICNDSRKAGPGMLYVAVKGYTFDGDDYIDEALRSGAAYVVTESRLSPNIPHITVENSRKALAALADAWYGHPSGAVTLIGVTGTNGKTTTTYLLKTILENVTATKVGLIGTNQVLIGKKPEDAERTTPESLTLQSLFARMRDAGCRYVVMEVSSHSLALDRVYKCDFDVGVFTNLTQDHLDFHKDMESYKKAKALLFDVCKTGVFNIDDPAGEEIMKTAPCRKISYGVDRDDGDVAAKNVRLTAAGVSYEALMNGAIDRISIGIPGKFSVYNSLAAVTAALALGFSLNDIAEGIRGATSVRGRAEVVHDGDFAVIVDYAHTPDGMENILRTARGFTEGRVIALFGCGGDRDPTKRPVMGRIGTELSDLAVITSDNPRTESPDAIIEQVLSGVDRKKYRPVVIPDRREAIHYCLLNARKGDTVLLLGKGHETYQEVGKVKHHFDDREEALLYFLKHPAG